MSGVRGRSSRTVASAGGLRCGLRGLRFVLGWVGLGDLRLKNGEVVGHVSDHSLIGRDPVESGRQSLLKRGEPFIRGHQRRAARCEA